MNFTVIGGNGFIGSNIVARLKSNRESVWVPKKDDINLFTEELGIVIYCAGYGDCQSGSLKVLDANTVLLSKVLEFGKFEKLIYISSTRVYMGSDNTREDSDVKILFDDGRKLFNLTKLLSEEILLKSNRNIKIVRPSNTYGIAIKSPLFLPSIVRDAVDSGVVNMFVSPGYSKDYVSVDDVAEITITIAKDCDTSGKIFNIASGENISAHQLADILIAETGCEVIWHTVADEENFPINDIELITSKYGFKPKRVLEDLVSMINNYKRIINGN